MERGPTALFGAIVAVGLGPALWLGAQVGAADASTVRPPAVISEHDAGSDKQLLGGTGGSVDTSEDGTTEIHATPRANVRPLDPEPSAKPSSSASADPEPSESTSPTPSESVDPSPSDEPSGEPSQPSSEPSDDPPSNGGGGDETDDPTTPPASSPSNDDGGSGGGGDNGGGDNGGSDNGEGNGGGDKGDTGPTVPTGENQQVSAH